MAFHRLLPLFLWLATVNGLVAADTLLLADKGLARLSVVISTSASESTKSVAAELADYLGRISGASFKVTTGDGSQGIVLGTLAEFPNPSLARPLEIRNTFDGREAFAIRTEKQRLLLIGSTDLGASHAAFRLLEHLGCRWFFPAREWEVLPRLPNLAISLNETDRPRILARRIWYGYGNFSDRGHPTGANASQDYRAWARHNCMASSFSVNAGHAWQTIIAANRKTFQEHPEYLALVKGERKGEQLCVSHPEVRRLAVKWALDFLQKHPERDMVSMECSDGGGQCECEPCVRMGNVSDRVFGLANEVATAVAAQYPGKMVGCLAYNEHSEPPRFPLEPNVHVQLTAGFTRGAYTFDQLAELWPQKCRNLGFYEYFSVWLWDFDKLPGGKGANIPRLRESIQRYARLGATSLDAESGNNWGVHGLGYYVANKLMWNPDADVEALRTDFFENAFGSAAPAMSRYYDRWAPEKQPLISRGLIGEMFRDLAEAESLAKDQPRVLARLDHLRHYLRYVHLRWLLDHEKDKAIQKELTEAILTLAYRTRYEYMNHWEAMRQSFSAEAAKKFNEPGWLLGSKDPKPWALDQPVTRAETWQWFSEGLEYFQPTPVTEVIFNYQDLAPASFPAAQSLPLTQAFQRSQRYALASLKGEPIELEITVGTIAWYRDRADATWTLKNAQGKVAAQGRQKLDGNPHKLTLPVPVAGACFFTCDDSSAGWRIQVPAGRPAVWLPVRGSRILPLGQLAERFFYVPRGTRQVQLFYSGAPVKILGARRQVLAEVKTSDEIVSIPVPENEDGRVWSLSPASYSQLWFFNVPNLLAASPDAFLLPREFMGKDQSPALPADPAKPHP